MRVRKTVLSMAVLLSSSSLPLLKLFRHKYQFNVFAAAWSTNISGSRTAKTSYQMNSHSSLSNRRLYSSLDSVHDFSFYHHPTIDSTQDEAKRILECEVGNLEKRYFAISASQQNKGRGTNGRKWIGIEGNMFLTFAFPMEDLPVPVTLLPLKIGCIMACTVKNILEKSSAEDLSYKVTLKWPNDVLIDEKKVGGVLIESGCNTVNNDYYFLVGIGINIVSTPEVPSVGLERGRTATSINDFLGEACFKEAKAEEIAKNISNQLYCWLKLNTDRNLDKDIESSIVVNEWKSHVTNWGKELILRDSEDSFNTVTPVSIEADGQLLVRDKFGKQRLLSADYLL